MSFQHEGVQRWVCRPAASPHAQLDTATAVRSATQLQGNWRLVSHRVVTHVDSVSFADKRIYRSVRFHPLTEPGTLQITDQKVILTAIKPSGKPGKVISSKYDLINQRYLLLYRASRAAGAVAQVGLTPDGRLVMHNSGVEERKVPGRYIVYRTVLNQSIYERQ